MARAPRSNIQSKATPAAKRLTSATAAPTVIKTAAGSKLGRPRPDGFVVSSKRAGTRILSQPPSKSGKLLPKESAGTSGDIRCTEAIRKVHAAFASGSVDVLVIAVDDVGSLTSQDVADILNVSRPYVVKLAKTGELPCQMVGTHHRFRAHDVQAYNERMRAGRRAALDAMSSEVDYRDEDF